MWFLWGIICQIKITHRRNAIRKKLFSCPECGSQFYIYTKLKDHIIRIHEAQDFTERKSATFAKDNSQGSEICKNILVEFMKALSYIYVTLVRNHLPKIPNWNSKSNECNGGKSRSNVLKVDHNSISLPEWKGHIIRTHELQDFTERKCATFARDNSQGSEVWKNMLVEFMKALSYLYVILVRNHLSKIPNWNW